MTNENNSPRLRAPHVVLIVAAAFSTTLLSGCFQREVLKVKATQQPAPVEEVKPVVATTKVKVYFVKEKAGELQFVPVDREVPEKDVLTAAVKALLEGPTFDESALGLASEIPKGTEFIDAKTSDEGVELNLSKKFSSDGGSESIETRLQQLSKTVSDAVHDRKVYLDVDGKRLSDAGGEGVEVQQPINM